MFDAKANFGARGDGVADDTDELQAALDEAAGAGPDCRETVLLPAGTYNITKPLNMRSYSTLDGEAMGNTTIIARPVGTNGDAVGTMVKLHGIRGATIQDLHLDGNNSGMTQREEHLGVSLSGTSDSAIRRVTISDLGDAQASRDPGGAHVHFSAYEPGDPKAGNLPTGLPTRNNVIEDNVFADGGYASAFGIRFITNYKLPRADSQYTVFVRDNIIRGNVFRGFDWNAVEIAGPGTRYNLITRNKFYNAHQDPIDADKGTKFNAFTYNLVDGVTQRRGNAAAAGIRDQGYPPTCANGVRTPQRYSEGNSYRNNTIRNVKSSQGSDPGLGAFFAWSKNAKVYNNKFANLRPASGGKAFAVFEYDHKYAPTRGLRAGGNTLNGKAVGIYTRAGTKASPC